MKNDRRSANKRDEQNSCEIEFVCGFAMNDFSDWMQSLIDIQTDIYKVLFDGAHFPHCNWYSDLMYVI